MDLATIAAVKGFETQARRFEIISNNLANVSTPGFKGDVFALDAQMQEFTYPDMSDGPTQSTGNPLDLAITGEGFFEVQTPRGLRYTRQGRFQLNANSELVTPQGDKVLSDRGQPITIQGNDVSIGPDGTIRVDGQEGDKIALVTFGQPKMLSKEGSTYYSATSPAGDKLEAPKQSLINQGFLEQSNITVTQEMVRMMDALRKFESFQKLINTTAEMDTKAATEVGMLR